MDARTLWEDSDYGDHRCGENRGCRVAAEGKPSLGDWLVEQVTERRAEGARKDEGGPEQEHP